MKYVQAKGLNLSAFALGTVQLGIEYGLGEHSAKPTEEAAFAILDRAVDLGVNTLDTANNYGDSEAVIGRWLTKRKADGKKLPYILTLHSLGTGGGIDTQQGGNNQDERYNGDDQFFVFHNVSSKTNRLRHLKQVPQPFFCDNTSP